MNIIEAIEAARFFRPVFKDLETWRAWKTFLRCLFGLPLVVAEDGPLVRRCTGSEYVPRGPFREAFVIAGRRSGKSFISAVIASFLAAFKDWRKHLAAGERGHIFIIANDKAQARIIKQYISGIFESNPSFRKLVKKDLAFDLELRNGVTISVRACNYRTIRGYTLLACILEEVAFYRDETSANPDREILAAVRPALSTVPESLLLGISTPYSRSGVLYEAFRKYYGSAEGPLIWKADTRTMNPTLDEELINRALAEDPMAARAEWLAEFREDVEALFSAELVDAAVVPGRRELPRVSGAHYVGFVDPSGGRQDSFTMGIAHRESSGKVVLDVVREARPPFKPEDVVAKYSDVLKSYKISRVEADRYAGEWVTDSLRRNGVLLKNSKKSKSELYLGLLPLVSNGSVELLDDKRLRSQLIALERRVRSGGRDQVDNFFGHDDVANACAGACVLAAQFAKARPRIRSLEDPQDREGYWTPLSWR